MRSLVVLGLTAALSAQTLVYDNGPFQTAATGGGATGSDPISVLQTLAPLTHNVYGFGAQNGANNRLADNFTVNSVLIIDQIEVFGYATGVTTPAATGVFLSIFDGTPGSTPAPTQLISGGGSTTNLISSATNTMTNIYRILDTGSPTTQTTRNVQSVRVTIPQLTLTPGTYWLEFSFTGLNFVPPLATTNVNATGDGLQHLGTSLTYAPIVNGPATSFCGLPFKFYSNSPTGTPGAITNLGGGCATSTFSVAGAPTVGGYFRAELNNTNPALFGLIVVGFSDPNSSLAPFCGCTSHASLDILNVANFLEVQVPLVAGLVGATFYMQGAQVDLLPVGGLPCNIGVQFELTDGYSYQININ